MLGSESRASNNCFLRPGSGSDGFKTVSWQKQADHINRSKYTVMGDEEGPQHRVEYLDVPEGGEEVTNWIKRAGKCKITYPNGESFEGNKITATSEIIHAMHIL
ncbi:hypothetical protein EON64_16335 [archaeon]|nr:MAG: hypothetical protein EON64_16335 [archaeon]